METRSNANQKRQLENENLPIPKRKSQPPLGKSRSSSISSDEQDEAKKITDLTDCCLEKIFEYLDMPNLCNVAAANKWLRPAAGVVYKRKLGNRKVCMINYRSPRRFQPLPFNSIAITGLKSCLQLLRCLGSSINVWVICYYGWTKKQSDHILQYLNEYCAENLTEIEFRSKPKGIPIIPFEKPFANVRMVDVTCGDLHDQLPSFAEWFPNMRTLKLERHRTLRHKDSAIKFDHLEHLSYGVYHGTKGIGFTEVKATRTLQQLPQLRSLDIQVFGNISFDATLNIIKNNQAIRNLKVDKNLSWQMALATASDIQRLMDEHPLLIKLELIGIKFAPDAVNLMISRFNSLKQLRFQIEDQMEYDRLVSQFDGQWRSSIIDGAQYHWKCVVQLER